MVTPRKRTWSLALMVSAPSWNEGPLLQSKAEPSDRRSVPMDKKPKLPEIFCIKWITEHAARCGDVVNPRMKPRRHVGGIFSVNRVS